MADDPIRYLEYFLRPVAREAYEAFKVDCVWSSEVMEAGQRYYLLTPSSGDPAVRFYCPRDVELGVLGYEVRLVGAGGGAGMLREIFGRRQKNNDDNPVLSSPPEKNQTPKKPKHHKQQTRYDNNKAVQRAKHADNPDARRDVADIMRLFRAHRVYRGMAEAQPQLRALKALVVDAAVELYGGRFSRQQLQSDFEGMMAHHDAGLMKQRPGRVLQNMQWGRACRSVYDGNPHLGDNSDNSRGMTRYMFGEAGLQQRRDAAAAAMRASLDATGRRARG